MRTSLRVALDAGANRHQLAVLVAVFHEITSYSRVWDWVSTRRLAEVLYGPKADRARIGYQRRKVTKALRGLDEMGSLIYEPEFGPNATPRIGLQTGVADEPPFDDGEGGSGEPPSAVKGGQSGTERGPIRNGIVATRRGHTEKTTEKTTEKSSSRTRPRARANVVPRDDATPTTPSRRTRARDPIFDALLECWQLDHYEITETERGRLNHLPAAVSQHRRHVHGRRRPVGRTRHARQRCTADPPTHHRTHAARRRVDARRAVPVTWTAATSPS
jgi:hypothetical protein